MRSADVSLFRSFGAPVLLHDGSVIVTRTTPDIAEDLYREVLLRVGGRAGTTVEMTHGPRDSHPAVSPDGRLIAFLRGAESGPKQLYVMPVDGGEPRRVAQHALGVSAPHFSPDGRSIAYVAALPEPGRYGSAGEEGDDDGDGARDAPGPEAEAPRPIRQLNYRSDGKGFVLDKPEQIYVVDVIDSAGQPIDTPEPVQVTAEPVSPGRPVFTPDGTALIYTRPTDPDSVRSDIVRIALGGAEPGRGSLLIRTAGDAVLPVVADDTVYFYGTEFDGLAFAGETLGLWAGPLDGGPARRLTDRSTVHVDAQAGEAIVLDGGVLMPVADRGAVALRVVPPGADGVALRDLPEVIGGRSVVRSFTVRDGLLAAVVADPSSTGDVVLTALGDGDAGSGADRRIVTDISRPLREARLGQKIELTGSAADGYPVHGWLVLPPDGVAAEPFPVLLAVHGGPHAAYTWAVFDEAQMYAAHGYAVVLPNPRGSSGYGLGHGRTIVGRLGTVDALDVLAVLDLALEHPLVGEQLDGARVGVMGGSYGGFMTSWLASHAPERFVAGISERAVNAWDSFAGTSDIGYFFAEAYVGADRDEQWMRSPLAYADDIAIPLLIIHSEHDWRCPLEQAQRLYVALKRRGHDTELLLFPAEGHELSRSGRPRHRQQRFDAILAWWERYLPVG